MNKLSDIGLIGLAVMGENLVLNMESKGFRVSVYNRSAQKVDDFLAGRAKGKKRLLQPVLTVVFTGMKN